MASAISSIHAPSKPDGRVEQHQSRDPARMGGRQLQGDRAAERVRHHDDGVIGLALEQSGQHVHVGVDRPRRVPRRVAMPDQIWCSNGDLGQVRVDQVSPTPAMPGEPMQCQQPHRAGRAEAVHVQAGHALIVPARRSPTVGRA